MKFEQIDNHVRDFEDTAEGRHHIEDMAAIRTQLELDGRVSNMSSRRTIGMSEGETMRLAGSIPSEVWWADVRLNPNMHIKERCKRLLKKFPQFALGSV